MLSRFLPSCCSARKTSPVCSVQKNDELTLRDSRRDHSCNPVTKIFGLVSHALSALKNTWDSWKKPQLDFFEGKLRNKDGSYKAFLVVPTLTKTYVLVTNLKLIKSALKHERVGDGPDAFFKGSVSSHVAETILGPNLLSYPASQHQNVRKAIAIYFSSSHLRASHEFLLNLTDTVIMNWVKINKDYFPPVRDLTVFVVEAVAKQFLNYQMPGNEIYSSMEILLSLGTKKRSRIEQQRFDKAFNFLEQSVRSVLPSEKKEEKSDKSSSPILDAASNISKERAKELARLMFFAGFDTTSSLIEYIIYELGTEINRHWQESIYKEWVASSLTLEEFALEPGSNLEKVCYEGLRLHPPAFVQTRLVANDLMYGQHLLTKGSELHICHYFAGRNSATWGQDAYLFKPERSLSSESLLLFSGGPTTCLGKQFAIMLTKIFLMDLIAQCQWVSKEQVFTKSGNVALKLNPDVQIKIQARKKT